MPNEIPNGLQHLRSKGRPEILAYSGQGRGKKTLFRRDRAQHAAYLRQQVADVGQAFEEIWAEREEQDLPQDFGLILNIVSEPGYPLTFTSFEQAATKTKRGVVVLNVRHEPTDDGPLTKVALFVPFGRLDVLAKKVEAYGDPTKDGQPDRKGVRHPKNETLLANIARIGVAALEALWTDPEPLPKDDGPHWWEMWIRRADDGNWKRRFLAQCERLQIPVPKQRLVLPDHVILVGIAHRQQLEGSLDLLNSLAEVRKPRPCSVGLTDREVDQDEWVEEALDRIEWPGDGAPAVCLIDTGVNRGHPLIEPQLAEQDATTVLAGGDVSDSWQHGTPMAGLAAFGDLRTLMLSTGAWRQLHRLESVKLIATGKEHDPENYGAVTQQAIYLPEIEARDRPRAYCLAITGGTPGDDGRPSSWSAAIDAAISGSQEIGEQRRLLLISAGNWSDFVDSYHYPDTLYAARIEDPAQAWNAVTVGAYTARAVIEEDDDESRRARAIAPYKGLSPFSRTSRDWEKRWPIKPEVVMEGGNLARTQQGDIEQRDSLELVTTAALFSRRPLTTLNATSAATALASRLGARLLEAYPDLWLESIRGLIVHSGRWTNQMLGNGVIDPHASGSSRAVESLLRLYGFGAVDEVRALASFSNRTTVVFQDTLQPYRQTAGRARLNECHLLALPWPKSLLEGALDVPAMMRVTLSYFIEPNPGSRVWEKNPKYHYPGCLLRFKVKHKDMDLDQFRAKLEAQQKDEDADEEEDEVATTKSRSLHDPGWALGGRLRGKGGSLVQDIWRGSAAQLAEMGHIAVYPVKGWWATRKFPEEHEHHGCHERQVRYSLIVSIETKANLPIYSMIEAAIAEFEAPAADIET